MSGAKMLKLELNILPLKDKLYIIASGNPKLCELSSACYLILTPTEWKNAAWRKVADAIDSQQGQLGLV